MHSPAAITSEYFSAPDGLKLHALSAGPRDTDRTLAICLPGLARTAEDFRELIEALAFDPKRPRRVLALDSRGRGPVVADVTTQNQTTASVDVKTATVRNGTTANYRSVHLQRLANPLLPWNPGPKLADGSANPEHQPNLPINPYRTIDSSSVNLTAFNGASRCASQAGCSTARTSRRGIPASSARKKLPPLKRATRPSALRVPSG